MSQIINITSEALQATVRRLLPSQQGFGEDLQASNVIMPVIDLTPTAEGSSVPTYLQTALAFGSQTSFAISNATSTIVNNAGFYRIFGVAGIRPSNGVDATAEFTLSDGLASKTIWKMVATQTAAEPTPQLEFDFTVFLRSGDSISGSTPNANCHITGSSRQVADINGVLVNPAGFTPQ